MTSSGPTLTLGQMMVPDPECLFEDDSLAEAIRKIEEFGYDQFPVIDNDESRRVVGVLTSRYFAVIGAGTLPPPRNCPRSQWPWRSTN